MSANAPQHRTNAETFLIGEELVQIESEAGTNLFETPARPRPPGRPRLAPSAEEPPPADVVEWIDCEAIPAPPGTKARPRPAGRERNGASEDGSNGAAVNPDADEQVKDAPK